jgi:hypothetical protein
MMLASTAAALAVASLAGAGTAPKVTVTAPGHTPKIKVHWNYTVSISQGGKPVAAKLTEQIVDPIGGVHAVQVGPTTKDITNLPVKGLYRDYIIWPAGSRGIPRHRQDRQGDEGRELPGDGTLSDSGP